VTLNFSENLSQLPTAVRVNGTPVTAVAFKGAGTTNVDTTKVEVSVALTPGSSASLFVAGAEDASTATNEMDIYNGTVTAPGNDANIIVTNNEGVRISAIDGETFLKTTDNKTYQVDVKAGEVALDAGTYTVSIPAEFFTDAYGNKTAAVSGKFTVGTATSTDIVKPTATVVSTSASVKNQFTVNFSEEVTGSGVALSNYRLDGQALPVGTDIYFTSAAKNQVVIQLPTNSVNIGNQTTGAAAILTVSGVTDKAANSITTANYDVVVKDNTAATASNVQVIGQDVYVTFTENVAFSTADADSVFNLTVNGAVVTAGNIEAVAGAANRVKFTLDAAPAATPVVTVKAGQTVVSDTNGTPVK
jgi:methionine-rich copper-binding protein CopC